MTAQIIYCVLTIMVITIHFAKHGEKKETEYNFWTELFYQALGVGLLYWGGFFDGWLK